MNLLPNVFKDVGRSDFYMQHVDSSGRKCFVNKVIAFIPVGHQSVTATGRLLKLTA